MVLAWQGRRPCRPWSVCSTRGWLQAARAEPLERPRLWPAAGGTRHARRDAVAAFVRGACRWRQALACIAQTGMVFSLHPLQVDFARLNPATRLQAGVLRAHVVRRVAGLREAARAAGRRMRRAVRARCRSSGCCRRCRPEAIPARLRWRTCAGLGVEDGRRTRCDRRGRHAVHAARVRPEDAHEPARAARTNTSIARAIRASAAACASCGARLLQRSRVAAQHAQRRRACSPTRRTIAVALRYRHGEMAAPRVRRQGRGPAGRRPCARSPRRHRIAGGAEPAAGARGCSAKHAIERPIVPPSFHARGRAHPGLGARACARRARGAGSALHERAQARTAGATPTSCWWCWCWAS